MARRPMASRPGVHSVAVTPCLPAAEWSSHHGCDVLVASSPPPGAPTQGKAHLDKMTIAVSISIALLYCWIKWT